MPLKNDKKNTLFFSCTAERKGGGEGGGGHRQSCDPGLQMILNPLLSGHRGQNTAVPFQTKLGNRGGGHLSPVPRLDGS